MRTVAVQEYDYYIAGEFRKSERTIDVVNPANEQVFARIFETSGQDIALAIEKAKKAQRIWRKTSFKERAKAVREIGQAMLDNLQVLAELETREVGKPLKESLFVDITLGADAFRYYASFLESLN